MPASKLSFLEGQVGVSSLRTSMRVLDSSPVSGLCSARRATSKNPCGAAGVGLVAGYSRDGVVIGFRVGAGKGVGKSADNCASSMARMDEME